MSKVFLVEECGVEERDSIQRRAIFLVFKNRDRERESKRYALSLRGCCLGAIRSFAPRMLPGSDTSPFPRAVSSTGSFFLVSLSCLPACLLALRWIECEAALQGERERESERQEPVVGGGSEENSDASTLGRKSKCPPPLGCRERLVLFFSLSRCQSLFFFSSSFFFFVLCLHSFGAPASVSTSRRSVRFCQCFDPVHACSFIRSLARSLDPSTHPSVRKSFYRSAFRGLLCPRVRTGGRGQ